MLLLPPVVWNKSFYLRYSPPAFVGFWCTAFLPRETRTLCRIAAKTRILSPFPPVVILLAVAAFLVSCSDLALQFGVTSGFALRQSSIQGHAWVTNILILFGAYTLAFAVTSKVSTSLLFVSPFYVVLGVATLLKLKYMHAAVVPLDLISIPEFLPLFRPFFGTGYSPQPCVGSQPGSSLSLPSGGSNLIVHPLWFAAPSGFSRWWSWLAVPILYSSEIINHRIYRLIGNPDFSPSSALLWTIQERVDSC